MNINGFTNAYDIIAEPGGLVFGAAKPDMSYTCQYCDSAILSKIDYNGNLQWYTAVAWGLNYYMPIARTTRLNNGSYIVASQNQSGIYYFSATGQFLERKLSPSSIQSITDPGDGNLLALQTESGNGYRIKLSKLSPAGTTLWSSYPEGRQLLANGNILCCTDSRPMSLLPLRNGGYLINGSRYIYTSEGNYNYMVVVLLQMDANGKYK
jgi:outer membrane protein assembly factor BamB